MILYGVRVIRYDILIRYFLNLFVCLIIVIIFKNSKTFSKIKLSPFPVSFKDILAFFHLCFPIFMFFFCGGGGGHCVKSVCIRSFSGTYFPASGLNTGRSSVSLRIQSECGKKRTRKTSNTDTFLALEISSLISTNGWKKTFITSFSSLFILLCNLSDSCLLI